MVRFHVGAQKNSPVARWRKESIEYRRTSGSFAKPGYLVYPLESGNVVIDLHGDLASGEAHADSSPVQVRVVLDRFALVEPLQELVKMTDYSVASFGGVVAIDIDRGAPKSPEVFLDEQHALFGLFEILDEVCSAVVAVCHPDHVADFPHSE